MVIDGHVHLGTSQFLQIHADLPMLFAVADEVGIDRLFVTHLTSLWYDMREGNDILGRELLRHPGRLLGYVTIPSPRYGPVAVDEVRRCVETYGMKGIKLYSHPEAPITESWTYPVLEAAARFGLMVLAHATPNECDHLMRHVPEARLVMAHTAGQPYATGNWHLAVEVAERHANLYLDTATSQMDDGMLEHAVQRVGAERILFGTDTPLLDPWIQRAKVEGAAVSDEAKRLILGGNLQRLLGL